MRGVARAGIRTGVIRRRSSVLAKTPTPKPRLLCRGAGKSGGTSERDRRSTPPDRRPGCAFSGQASSNPPDAVRHRRPGSATLTFQRFQPSTGHEATSRPASGTAPAARPARHGGASRHPRSAEPDAGQAARGDPGDQSVQTVQTVQAGRTEGEHDENRPLRPQVELQPGGRRGRQARPGRAGAAGGGNPISVIVPCHRVVGGDGGPTGFTWGLARKGFLLEPESSARTRQEALF